MPITLRFRDIDARGHVNNAVYFTFFEEGRRALYSGARLGFTTVVAHNRCDYINPLEEGERVALDIRTAAIGRTSFRLRYRLRRAEDPAHVFAEAETVQVRYDFERRCALPIEPALREYLQRYMEAPEQDAAQAPGG